MTSQVTGETVAGIYLAMGVQHRRQAVAPLEGEQTGE